MPERGGSTGSCWTPGGGGELTQLWWEACMCTHTHTHPESFLKQMPHEVPTCRVSFSSVKNVSGMFHSMGKCLEVGRSLEN